MANRYPKKLIKKKKNRKFILGALEFWAKKNNCELIFYKSQVGVGVNGTFAKYQSDLQWSWDAFFNYKMQYCPKEAKSLYPFIAVPISSTEGLYVLYRWLLYLSRNRYRIKFQRGKGLFYVVCIREVETISIDAVPEKEFVVVEEVLL